MLRQIVILEANFNTGAKIVLGNSTTDNAIQNNQVPESQYTPQIKKAIEANIIKRLFKKSFRLYKKHAPSYLMIYTGTTIEYP